MSRLSCPSLAVFTIFLLGVSGANQPASAREATASKVSMKTIAASGQGEMLAAAIKAFNAKSQQNRIGKQQPPLTEEEVIAAIQLSEQFEVLTGIDPGEDFIYDVWYVRIMLPKEDSGTYSFTIRNRIVRAHPVGEVAKELEERLKTIPPLPGRYRIEDRIKETRGESDSLTMALFAVRFR